SLLLRHSPRHFWIAGRTTAPGASLVDETRAIMTEIDAAMQAQGLRFDQVCKATTHYVGSSDADALHANMAVRNAYYRQPGPASTGLPVVAFPAAPGRIAIDLLGTLG